jgi:1,4-dihydroxy-2-naphthoate octaprenyltransferase
VRLVGSRLARPEAVRTAAFACFGVAALAGLVLLALSGLWWLAAAGAACIAGAWFYTGGRRPYGYEGLGEVAVFVFFGPVAVLGTMLTQAALVTWSAVVVSVAVGGLTSAVLVANNLRDIPTDALAGKHTLAVALGDARTRVLYVALVLGPLAVSAVTAGFLGWPLLLGLLAAPLAVGPVRRVLGGAAGRELIPVLAATGVVLLTWSAATGVGLALAG